MILSNYKSINLAEERMDIYRKLKDVFDYLASIVFDEDENIIYRLRAIQNLSNIAKVLRLFILDVEKIGELGKEVEELRTMVTKRINRSNKRRARYQQR